MHFERPAVVTLMRRARRSDTQRASAEAHEPRNQTSTGASDSSSEHRSAIPPPERRKCAVQSAAEHSTSKDDKEHATCAKLIPVTEGDDGRRTVVVDERDMSNGTQEAAQSPKSLPVEAGPGCACVTLGGVTACGSRRTPDMT